jgi:hypothetical protein
MRRSDRPMTSPKVLSLASAAGSLSVRSTHGSSGRSGSPVARHGRDRTGGYTRALVRAFNAVLAAGPDSVGSDAKRSGHSTFFFNLEASTASGRPALRSMRATSLGSPGHDRYARFARPGCVPPISASQDEKVKQFRSVQFAPVSRLPLLQAYREPRHVSNALAPHSLGAV